MAAYLQQPHLHTQAQFRAALLTYPGNLQEALRQAQEDHTKTLFGVAHGIPSVFLTKVLASTKPDFIWIDVEHGMFNRLELHDAIQAAQHHSEGKSLVIVRVPFHDEISLTTALDAGAAGIVLPHCEDPEAIAAKMKEIYYPPIGQRSFSPWTFTPGVSDASLYAKDSFNMETSNRHVAVIPQVESVKGIENVEKIAAIEGVAGLMFGPGDYMADAGIPLSLGEPDPRLLEAMGKLAAAGKKYNKPLVGAAQQIEAVPMMVEQGFRVIAVYFDVWGTAQTVSGNLAAARNFVQPSQKTTESSESQNTVPVSKGTDNAVPVSNGAENPLTVPNGTNGVAPSS